jgi:bidirectional [NiFe] hydrogenase diaphorase subunit
MIEFTIDGRKISAEEGETILQAARRHNIYIPSLCHNEGLSDYGACRICLVELRWPNGGKKLVTSCLYPVAAGLDVYTKSEWVVKTRRGVIELILARSPHAPAVKKLAAELGVKEVNPRFVQDPENKCILCGMCIRACEEVVGVSAINFSGHGITRKACTPYDEANPVCIGCGACAYVCPTDVIKFEDLGAIRKIWHRDFQMRKCEQCGANYMPKAQVEFIKKKVNLPDEFFNKCPDCR